jgi:hypothetical protein
LICRDDFSRAEKVCTKIFKEKNVINRLMKMKLEDQLSEEYYSTGYWPTFFWQPTFRKIICCFVFIWSILSLISFFVNEEAVHFLRNNINDYSLQNFVFALCNGAISFIYIIKYFSYIFI